MTRINVKHDILCNYCNRNLGTVPNTCECLHCETAKNRYLADNDITVSYEKSTFTELSIGDTIYIIDRKPYIPCVNPVTVDGLSISKGSPLSIHHKSYTIYIPRGFINRSFCNDVYLSNEVAQEALVQICLERINELSKQVDSAWYNIRCPRNPVSDGVKN